jgi:hypothetical protein
MGHGTNGSIKSSEDSARDCEKEIDQRWRLVWCNDECG